MSATSPASPAKSSRKTILVAVLVLIPVIILLVPALVYGGFTVPVRKITFGETTGSLTTIDAQVTVEMQTVYEYMFSTRMGARVRTADTDVSPSRGTANITISLKLTNPSNDTIDLGKIDISGSAGTRHHTVYLGVDEGVRLPGSYVLDIVITVSVRIGSLIDISVPTTIQARFNVS